MSGGREVKDDGRRVEVRVVQGSRGGTTPLLEQAVTKGYLEDETLRVRELIP